MPIIDPEFRELIPPLSKGEREALRLSIQRDGVRDPVVLWGEIVVDGHNRHEIATELGVAYPTVQRDFADREAVRQWILDNQCARRNLTPDQVVAIAALRGVDPPPAFRGLSASVRVREILANGGSLARVVAGEQTARTAHNDMRRARGEILRKPPRRPAPAVAPAAPPLETVRAKRETQAQTSTERRAIRDALDRIAELETQLHVIEHENSTPLPAVPRLRLTGTRRSGAAVALLSDVHAGAVVEQSHSSYGNRYSPAICRYRVRRWFAGVAWHVKAYREVAWDLRHLVLWFGGDMVDGHLHRDSQETSQTCIEAIDWLEPILVDGVRGLREELDCDVDLVMSYGNHPRDTKKPCRARGAAHNHEWGMYQRIARQLTPDGVQCLADPTAHQYHRVFDYELHFHHGDETNYGGGVGGISIPLNKAFAQWDKVRHADLHHIGHWHQQLDGGRWLANGCVKGYDPYAMSVKGTPEPPQQTFYVLDEKRGKTAVTPLWVSDPIDEARL